jgi:HEAT repeat protein
MNGQKPNRPGRLLALAAWLTAAIAAAATPTRPKAEPLVSFFEQEVRRFTRLAGSGIAACQVEAAQGFYYLRHHRGELPLLPLAGHDDPLVRLEAVKALGVCGGRRSVPALIDRLADGDWEVRTAARDALARMTAAGPFADRAAGLKWLRQSTWQKKQADLLKRLTGKGQADRLAALRALRYVGDATAEDEVLRRGPAAGPGSVQLVALALERIGTKKSLPALVRAGPHVPEPCWALAEIGGEGVEGALLAALARWRDVRLDAMINLDRIGSTKCGPHLPMLLHSFGLLIYRSQIDDLHFPPTAFQRVAASLILRTGQSRNVVDLILAECEGKRTDADTPPHLRATLAAMRKEFGTGFVRNDGRTVAQPLAAVPHIIRDRRFIPRLIGLLNHRAFLVRIYAAESLAALKAEEAVEPIIRIIRTPYGFPDETTQVSGKHFGRSQIVRWRGYVCIALGKLGGERARQELETLAGDPKSYRDIRYGSVVGLRFLASARSIPALQRIATEDIIREIRREAAAATQEAQIARRLARSEANGE